MTADSVYRDEAISVGKVINQTTDAELGVGAMGTAVDADRIWTRRESGGLVTTGYVPLTLLQTYFNTGAGSWDFSGLDASGALAGANLALVMQSGVAKRTTLTAVGAFSLSEVTNLAAAGALAGADLALVSQSSVGKKTTLTDLAAFVGTTGSGGGNNYEVLAGNKTLSIGSPRNQFLSLAANRDVTLDATCNVAGTSFYIVHANDTGDTMSVKNSGGTLVKALQYLAWARFTYNGASWDVVTDNTIRNGTDTFVAFHTIGTTYVSNASQALITVKQAVGVGVKLGGSIPTSLFHVSATGNSNALLVDDTTGHVGINGAPDASYHLMIGGTKIGQYYSGTEAYTQYASNSITSVSGVISTFGGSVIGNVSNNQVDIAVNNTSVLRAQVGGNISIGSTTDYGERLNVVGGIQQVGANEQGARLLMLTEETTMAVAAFTDTAIQIPAGALVYAVSTYVGVQPTGTATYDVGIAGATTRYTTAASSAAATTSKGTADAMRYYAAATAIRITTDIPPIDNAGRIRVTIHYISVDVPTS